MANGKGCVCAARYAGECACDDVDWNPPKKEFIELTDDEIHNVADTIDNIEYACEYINVIEFARAIEQALKEKNNGI
jgi:hypothetical protein